jgi:hypothetical protein
MKSGRCWSISEPCTGCDGAVQMAQLLDEYLGLLQGVSEALSLVERERPLLAQSGDIKLAAQADRWSERNEWRRKSRGPGGAITHSGAAKKRHRLFTMDPKGPWTGI